MEPVDVTALLTRKLIHDITPCGSANDVMLAMGLVPGSEEGYRVEHRASHLRLNRLMGMNQVIQQIGAISGQVVGRCILEDQESDVDEDQINLFSVVASATAQAVVANLVDMGLLHIGGHA